jgi:hypothetical protein
VRITPGNHDLDYFWPSVLARLREAVGGHAEPSFQFVWEGAIQERGVYIEHGNQYAYDNRVNHWENPIILSPDGPRLERPWGTLFMDTVYSDAKELYPFVNKVHPWYRLLWIGIKSFVRGHIPADRVARFLWFFGSKGKRFIWDSMRMLGAEELPGSGGSMDIAGLVSALDPDLAEARRAEIVRELEALRASEPLPSRRWALPWSWTRSSTRWCSSTWRPARA